MSTSLPHISSIATAVAAVLLFVVPVALPAAELPETAEPRTAMARLAAGSDHHTDRFQATDCRTRWLVDIGKGTPQ